MPSSVEVSPGNRIRIASGERLSGECARQASSDRLGTIDVTPLLWLGSLPGSGSERAMYVRDLGPEVNRELLTQTGRTAYMLMTPRPGASPELVPYDRAVTLLWGSAAEAM